MLFILDDAGIYKTAVNETSNTGGVVQVGSTDARFASVPAKFNTLSRMAPEADVYVVWEDDDIYLPWHLSCIAASWQAGAKFIAPDVFLSNYGMHFGQYKTEYTGRGRMHGAWAYDGEFFREIGGYDESVRLSFDQEMHAKCSRAVGVRVPFDNRARPSYVYRWGRHAYNGSQSGADSYDAFYKRLGELPCEPQSRVYAECDEETQLILKQIPGGICARWLIPGGME